MPENETETITGNDAGTEFSFDETEDSTVEPSDDATDTESEDLTAEPSDEDAESAEPSLGDISAGDPDEGLNDGEAEGGSTDAGFSGDQGSPSATPPMQKAREEEKAKAQEGISPEIVAELRKQASSGGVDIAKFAEKHGIRIMDVENLLRA